jgi:hypothetical protein
MAALDARRVSFSTPGIRAGISSRSETLLADIVAPRRASRRQRRLQRTHDGTCDSAAERAAGTQPDRRCLARGEWIGQEAVYSEVPVRRIRRDLDGNEMCLRPAGRVSRCLSRKPPGERLGILNRLHTAGDMLDQQCVAVRHLVEGDDTAKFVCAFDGSAFLLDEISVDPHGHGLCLSDIRGDDGNRPDPEKPGSAE